MRTNPTIVPTKSTTSSSAPAITPTMTPKMPYPNNWPTTWRLPQINLIDCKQLAAILISLPLFDAIIHKSNNDYKNFPCKLVNFLINSFKIRFWVFANWANKVIREFFSLILNNKTTNFTGKMVFFHLNFWFLFTC